MFLDGVRDLGEYNRDTFNLQAVEVLKGPSALMFGRGSPGGIINQVSKVPTLQPLKEVGLSLGTYGEKRLTGDLNLPIGATSALSLAAMGKDSEIYVDTVEVEKLGIDFDCIVLHGVYSWVPETVRGEIRQFVQRRLKPGGLCMLSYNTMPGWAHLQPLRRMMQAYAHALPGDTLQKARAAFAYVSFLAEHGAAYFRTLPAAAEHLKIVAHDDIRYVAHEYLTSHGDPFYFSDVEGAMRGITSSGSSS